MNAVINPVDVMRAGADVMKAGVLSVGMNMDWYSLMILSGESINTVASYTNVPILPESPFQSILPEQTIELKEVTEDEMWSALGKRSFHRWAEENEE